MKKAARVLPESFNDDLHRQDAEAFERLAQYVEAHLTETDEYDVDLMPMMEGDVYLIGIEICFLVSLPSGQRYYMRQALSGEVIEYAVSDVVKHTEDYLRFKLQDYLPTKDPGRGSGNG
jgi:hypothetical protein